MIGNSLRKNASVKSLLTTVAFIALLLIIAVVHLFGAFKGMSHREAMEAASVGRELVRGNGFNNKVIYPAALFAKSKSKETINLTNHQNTYTAPGNAVVNAGVLALIDGGNYDKHRVKPGTYVYTPDRALAIASMCFLLVAIVFTYLLVKDLFDKKIANTTAFIMLTSGTIWQFVQSCLPQMFLLMLFCMILWILHRAFVIFEKEGRTPWLPLVACAALFGVMAVTKWLTLWIFAGYLAAILTHFKPRGAVALTSLIIASIFIAPAVIFNIQQYGTPFGQAGFTLVNSLTSSEEEMLRDFDQVPVQIDGLVLNFARLTISQMSNIVALLGGLIVAPVFFLSLMHEFRRTANNHLKFAVVFMWIPAVVGMSIFGGRDLSAPHQLHILFAPIMAALGIAVVAVMWARLSIARSHSAAENAHLYVIGLLCAGPMLVSMPKMVEDTFHSKGEGRPNAPYYQTAELNNDLHDMVKECSKTQPPVIISDQPAATAWYSDIHSIALPRGSKQFEEIDNYAKKQDIEIAGIHTSALSTRHIYNNVSYSRVMPLVNLPLVTAISGIPAHSSLSTLSESWQGRYRSPWEKTAKTYPYSRNIISINRQEFKDFGHHIFHARNKIDE